MARMQDAWQHAESYEQYIGRWSRSVAREFVPGLSVAPGAVWLDVGCGSGALTAAILELAEPARVTVLDRSYEFVRHFRRVVSKDPASLLVADAVSLPFTDGKADAVVSGLVLNFVPDPERAVREMLRAVRPGGVVSTYVWDYAEGMQLIRLFWDAAVALDPGAAALDEAARFPLCDAAALEQLFVRAGAAQVATSAITISTPFRDFDDLWMPFLGAQGPAPTYAMSLSEQDRGRFRERFLQTVPTGPDGSIELSARAWVVRGVRLST
jgi:SAM-dependent methyltransferase